MTLWVLHEMLRHHRIRHDAAHDREVAEAEQIPGHLAATPGSRVRQSVFDDPRHIGEVRPPQHTCHGRRGDHRSQSWPIHARALRRRGGGRADRDQDFAEGDDHEERVSFGEMHRVD